MSESTRDMKLSTSSLLFLSSVIIFNALSNIPEISPIFFQRLSVNQQPLHELPIATL